MQQRTYFIVIFILVMLSIHLFAGGPKGTGEASGNDSESWIVTTSDDVITWFKTDFVTYTKMIGAYTGNFFKGLCNDTVCALFDEETDKDYLKTWTVRALTLQNRVDKYAPLKRAGLPHTHNSYNAAAYMTSISYLDPNHEISVLNQLNIGIRALEYDIHWATYDHGWFDYNKEVILCHNGGDGTCSIWDRLFSAGLEEIKLWFSVPDHKANDVILVTLEDHLDGHYAEAVAAIESQIGDLVYKPKQACDALDWNISKAAILAAGKNVILMGASAASCKEAHYGSYVHQNNWSGGVKHTSFVGYPTCKNDTTDLETIQDGFYRSYTDGTVIGQVYLGVAPIEVSDVEKMAGCGINAIGPEPLDWWDPRHEAQIWSWNKNEPDDVGENEDCAEQAENGRFNAIDCVRSLRFACQNAATREWKVTSTAGPWKNGKAACENEFGPGFTFAVPANGYENNQLKDIKTQGNQSSVWLHYSDTVSEGDWQPGF